MSSVVKSSDPRDSVIFPGNLLGNLPELNLPQDTSFLNEARHPSRADSIRRRSSPFSPTTSITRFFPNPVKLTLKNSSPLAICFGTCQKIIVLWGNNHFPIMKFASKFKLFAAALLLGSSLPLFSQEAADAEMSEEDAAAIKEHYEFIDGLNWVREGTAPLGSRAELAIPEGFRFTGAPDASKLMEYYGNLTNGAELGYISPEEMEWFAVFEFDDIGYVKDDEKDELDADKILNELREGQKAANEELTSRGMSTLNVVGWHTPPFYNTDTKNLEWAIKLSSSDGGEILNYKTKILGRRGVMDVVLVCDEDQLASVIPQYQSILNGFSFKKEESYASYEKGDKIAEYGLIGLIAGGGLLVAAKSGLLAKLWKPIAIGLVAIGAFIKRIFKGKNHDAI